MALTLPLQDISAPIPPGYVRVIFFNDESVLRPGSNGKQHCNASVIRIKLDGKVSPNLYTSSYVQLFLKPGKYELQLERWFLATLTDQYRVEIQEPKAYFRVWSTLIGTNYEKVEAVPLTSRRPFTSSLVATFDHGFATYNWPDLLPIPPACGRVFGFP
jgi:hypothetical protein